MVHDALDGAPGYGGEVYAMELVAAFPSQPLDFFGAVRSRCADDAVRRFIAGTGLENLGGAAWALRVLAAPPVGVPSVLGPFPFPPSPRARAAR